MDLTKFFPGLKRDENTEGPPTEYKIPTYVPPADEKQQNAPPPPTNILNNLFPGLNQPAPVAASASANTREIKDDGMRYVQFNSQQKGLEYDIDLQMRKSSNELMFNPIAEYKSVRSELLEGTQIALSSDFICYAIKKGHLRIIHSQTVQRTLLKGHTKIVTDLSFCSQQESFLATIAPDGLAIIWELIFKNNAIQHREVLRVASPSNLIFKRVEWHPTNPKCFALVCGSQFGIIEMTPELIQIQSGNPKNGIEFTKTKAIIADKHHGPITDITFTADGNHIATSCKDGTVNIWKLDLNTKEVSNIKEFVPHDQRPVNRVSFINGVHDSYILTSTANNSELRLWQSPCNPSWTAYTEYEQEIKLNCTSQTDGSAMSAFKYSMSKNCSYIAIGDVDHNILLCINMNANRFDSLIQFMVNSPILSLNVYERGQANITAELAIYVIQTQTIYQYHFEPSRIFQAKSTTPASGGADVVATNDSSNRAMQLLGALPLMSPTSAAAAAAAADMTTMTPSGADSGCETRPISTGESSSSGNLSSNNVPVLTTTTSSPAASLSTANSGIAAPSIPLNQNGTSDANISSGALAALENRLQENFSKEINNLYKKLSADAEKRTEEDVKRIKVILNVLSKSTSDITDNVEDIITEQLDSDKFKANIAQIVSASQQQGSGGMSSSQNKKLVDDIIKNINKPINNAFVECFRNNVIPSFEAGCNNMMNQFDAMFQKGINSRYDGDIKSQYDSLVATREQLNAALAKTNQLISTTENVAQLLQNSASGGGMNAPGNINNIHPNALFGSQPDGRMSRSSSTGSMQAPPQQDPRVLEQKIMMAMEQKDWENAFYMALNANNALLLMNLCRHINVEQLFRMQPFPLSQTILLSLMQQLSAHLKSSTEKPVILHWLENIAVTVRVDEPTIAPYSQNVVSIIKHCLEDAASSIWPDIMQKYRTCCILINNLSR